MAETVGSDHNNPVRRVRLVPGSTPFWQVVPRYINVMAAPAQLVFAFEGQENADRFCTSPSASLQGAAAVAH